MDSDQQNPEHQQPDYHNSDTYHNFSKTMAYPGYYYMPMLNYGHPSQTGNLNPSLPPFQPTGVELQRSQPRSAIDPEMKEMQKWVAETTANQLNNVARIERKVDDNAEKYQQLEDTMRHDIHYVHSKVNEVWQALSQAGISASKASTPENEITQEQETMQVISRPQEANEGTETSLVAGTTRRLLEAPDGTVAEHVCCGTAYAEFFEMLDHIYEHHLTAVPASVAADSPMLARRELEPRPHAAEIKPREVEKTEIKAQESDASSPLATEAAWMPAYVRQMNPLSGNIPSDHAETFSADFLQELFKGRDFCDGFHFMPSPLDLGMRTYWILEEDHQPFLPKAPGEHGAKLTALPNEAPVARAEDVPEVEHAMNVPVFIRNKDGSGYRYFGHYSQTRFSDKLDFDTLVNRIPDSTLKYWASKLSESGRPEWVTTMLIAHFFPRPEYWGRLPTDSAVSTPNTAATPSASSVEPLERIVKDALRDYAYELKDWEKSSRVNASLLTEQNIYESFFKADGDEVKGLRPWWEYFECVEYNESFYRMLVDIKAKPNLAFRPSKPKSIKPRRDLAAGKAEWEQGVIDSKKPTTFVSSNGFTEDEDAARTKSNTPAQSRPAPSKPEVEANGWSPSKTKVETNGWVSSEKSTGGWQGSGDINAAKALNDSFKKNGPPAKRGGGDDSSKKNSSAAAPVKRGGGDYVPPHRRAAK